MSWRSLKAIGRFAVAALLVLVLGVAPAGAAIAAASSSQPRALGPAFDPVIASLLAQVKTAPVSGADELKAEQDWLKLVIQELMKRFPDGSENQRGAAFDTAFVAYFLIVAGSIVLPPTAMTAGGLIGAGVGALGIVTGPGVVLTVEAGTAIGAGVGAAGGTAATMAVFCGATLLMVPLMLYLNEQYPPETAMSSSREDFAYASLRTTAQITRKKPVRYAGTGESMLIHLIDSYYTDKILQLSALWDAMPGLTTAQRTQLRSMNFLRPSVNTIAYIKQHKRLAPNAPLAQPLTGWMGQVIKLVTADSETMRQAWLTALGVSGLRAHASGGSLKVYTPQTFVAVGAPPSFSVPIPQASARVGGTGGDADPWLEAKGGVGPFDVSFGVPSISGNRIKVSYEIEKGSKAATGQLKYKWRGDVGTIGDWNAKTDKDYEAALFFKPEGHLLAFDSASVGDVDLKLGLPALGAALSLALSPLMDLIVSPLKNSVEKMIRDNLKWSNVLTAQGTYSTASLLRMFKSNQSTYGLLNPTKIEELLIQSGVLKARVGASKLNLPALKVTKQDVENAMNAVPRPKPVLQRRRIGA